MNSADFQTLYALMVSSIVFLLFGFAWLYWRLGEINNTLKELVKVLKK